MFKNVLLQQFHDCFSDSALITASQQVTVMIMGSKKNNRRGQTMVRGDVWPVQFIDPDKLKKKIVGHRNAEFHPF